MGIELGTICFFLFFYTETDKRGIGNGSADEVIEFVGGHGRWMDEGSGWGIDAKALTAN
jgi:hypothetical protein